MKLPNFGLDSWIETLHGLAAAGYELRTVSRMADDDGRKAAYLRHDVDFDLPLVAAMAAAESAKAFRATYYVLLTGMYNVLRPDCRDVLQTLRGQGHEVGLHYDLERYPKDPVAARARLDWERGILAEVVGAPVASITMHQPYKGHPDPFQRVDDLLNPHDPRLQADLVYVSESCRAWRDEKLTECLGPNGPRRLLLNTHPELWLDGAVRVRTEYLERVLIPRVTRAGREHLDTTVRRVWAEHPGPKAHDARERGLS